ncbi:hypothetical protein MMC34_006290 [Xylographa carneopallida]|nr:hypothetical protein [Xylographa carneopallida]
MTGIGLVLVRLGLSQYTTRFIDEGFETWETVLDITESDLDLLNVKLGHRRKLQREIATARGVSLDQIVASPVRVTSNDDYRHGDGDNDGVGDKHDKRRGDGRGGKRKYRRHPKPDENAPERPPSAYVIFSNKCREELKPQNLSFTSIAKLVGERWQALGAGQKDPFESQAASLKETYNAELAKYRRTSGYKTYLEYLIDFKAKNANPSSGMESKTKRPKLDTHDSTESSESTNSRHGSAGIPIGSRPRRLDRNRSVTGSPVLAMPPPFVSTAKSTSSASMSPMTFSPHSSPGGNRLAGLPTASKVDGTSNWTSETSATTPLPRILSLDDQEIAADRSRGEEHSSTKVKSPPGVPFKQEFEAINIVF